MKTIIIIAAVIAGIAGVSSFAFKSAEPAGVVLKNRVHTIDQAIDEATN